MILIICSWSKCSITTFLRAHIRAFPCMCAHMNLSNVGCCERSSTARNRTPKRTFSWWHKNNHMQVHQTNLDIDTGQKHERKRHTEWCGKWQNTKRISLSAAMSTANGRTQNLPQCHYVCHKQQNTKKISLSATMSATDSRIPRISPSVPLHHKCHIHHSESKGLFRLTTV
jgi:hypothetical protein